MNSVFMASSISMGSDHPHRLRLKLPDGSEFEAEGSAEFIEEQRREFLRGATAALEPAEDRPPPSLGEPRIAWDAITEHKGKGLQLRAKLPSGKTEKDACLVLLACSHRLLNEPKPTATQLAKWLRASGYPILRMDRALQDAVDRGEILSSGSRRARRYELTAPGRMKAHILAYQLSQVISGQA